MFCFDSNINFPPLKGRKETNLKTNLVTLVTTSNDKIKKGQFIPLFVILFVVLTYIFYNTWEAHRKHSLQQDWFSSCLTFFIMLSCTCLNRPQIFLSPSELFNSGSPYSLYTDPSRSWVFL